MNAMHRHWALLDLSRDHHAALIEARRLRQAAGGAPAELRAAVAQLQEHWEDDVLSHLADEERRLGALIADADALDRLVDDHAILRALAATVFSEAESGRVDPDRIRLFAQHLEANVRWEEEELFPSIERCADPAALAALDCRHSPGDAA